MTRMCHAVEEGWGRQCSKKGSHNDFVLEVGDKFVEVSSFL